MKLHSHLYNKLRHLPAYIIMMVADVLAPVGARPLATTMLIFFFFLQLNIIIIHINHITQQLQRLNKQFLREDEI